MVSQTLLILIVVAVVVVVATIAIQKSQSKKSQPAPGPIHFGGENLTSSAYRPSDPSVWAVQPKTIQQAIDRIATFLGAAPFLVTVTPFTTIQGGSAYDPPAQPSVLVGNGKISRLVITSIPGATHTNTFNGNFTASIDIDGDIKYTTPQLTQSSFLPTANGYLTQTFDVDIPYQNRSIYTLILNPVGMDQINFSFSAYAIL